MIYKKMEERPKMQKRKHDFLLMRDLLHYMLWALNSVPSTLCHLRWSGWLHKLFKNCTVRTQNQILDTNYTLGMPKRALGVPRGMEGSPPTGIVCPNLVYSLSIHIPQNNSAQCLTQAVRSCLIRKRQKHIREQTEKRKKKKIKEKLGFLGKRNISNSSLFCTK